MDFTEDRWMIKAGGHFWWDNEEEIWSPDPFEATFYANIDKAYNDTEKLARDEFNPGLKVSVVSVEIGMRVK